MSAQTTANSSADSMAPPPGARREAEQMVPVKVHLVREIDARKDQPGGRFEAQVDDTVHLKTGTELPRGTVLVGTIVTDQMQDQGLSRLALRFTQAKLKDGQVIPIEATIAGITGPAYSAGYTEDSSGPPSWSPGTLQVDELGVVKDVDLHSRIGGANSGVLVSTTKDNVKLNSGSRMTLAIAAENTNQATNNPGS
ncbi:MAG TPA: hypothetical protein VGF96_04265 [Terracidiphilus sp.]